MVQSQQEMTSSGTCDLETHTLSTSNQTLHPECVHQTKLGLVT